MNSEEKEFNAISSLCNCSLALHTSKDLDAALENLVDSAIDNLKIKGCSVKILNDRRTRLDISSVKGLSQDFLDRVGVYGMFKSAVNQQALEGKAVFIEDLSKSTDFNIPGELFEEGIKSIACLPIRIERQVIGVLSIYDDKVRTFEDDEKAFIKALAVQGAAVVNSLRNYQRMESLLNVAKIMNASLDLDYVLNQICILAVRTMKVKASSIRLLNQSTNKLIFKNSFGLSKEYIEKIPMTLQQSPIDKTVLQDREVLYIEDITMDPRIIMGKEAKEEGLASMLCTPMILKDEVIGILKIYTTTPVVFTTEEIQYMKSLGEMGAMAIKNASLYEKLHSLYQVTSSLTSTLDTERVLDLVAMHAADYLSAMGSQVLMWDKDTEKFTTRAVYHLNKDFVDSLNHMGQAQSAKETLEGSTIIVSNFEDDNRTSIEKEALKHGILSMVSVPLKMMDRVTGILQIYCGTARNFTSDEVEFLTALANHGAVALANARLHERLRADYDKLIDDIYIWHDWTSYVIRE